ncbi:hypothetical protein [Rhizobium sp. L1K21]|uniref:hypothetical protein n=1 Tax=Rhizobium sp. L1K21 TaxID=2954933 RepID=UPI002092932E|nr:hypothetical protein [Rhizobium sp. L1K21]MCO6185228.1 hypothetical protein [Rhizobium sp. L1K21]
MDSIEKTGALTPQELEEAINEFSDADLLRLKKVSQLYAHYPVEPEELLQEAYCRALAGTRSCPRNVRVVKFIAEAMRSIAHNELQKIENQREEISLQDEELQNSVALTLKEPSPTAEERMITNETVRGTENRLLDLFDGDEEAQLIVIGMLTGSEGAELRLATGLDQTSFNTKRRYIRRKLNDARQNGFTL